jgi:hypothetical protein
MQEQVGHQAIIDGLNMLRKTVYFQFAIFIFMIIWAILKLLTWKMQMIIWEAILMIIILLISIASHLTLRASINHFYKFKKEFILPKIYIDLPLDAAIVGFLFLVISVIGLSYSPIKLEQAFPGIFLLIVSILLVALVLLSYYIGIIIFFLKLREILNISLLQIAAVAILVPLCTSLIPGFIGMVLLTIESLQLQTLSKFNQQSAFQIQPYNVVTQILGFFTLNLAAWLIVSSSIKMYKVHDNAKCFILRSKNTKFHEEIDILFERVEYILIDHFYIGSWKAIVRKDPLRTFPIVFTLVIPELMSKLIITIKRPYYKLMYGVEFENRTHYIVKLAKERGKHVECLGISLDEVYEKWKEIFSISCNSFIKTFIGILAIGLISGFTLMFALLFFIVTNVLQPNIFIATKPHQLLLATLLLCIIGGLTRYSKVFLDNVNNLINFRIAERVRELIQEKNIAVLVIRDKEYAKSLEYELRKRNISCKII